MWSTISIYLVEPIVYNLKKRLFFLLWRAIASCRSQNFLLEAIQQSTGRVTIYSEINRPWRDYQKQSSLEMIGGKFSLSGFRDLPKVKTFSHGPNDGVKDNKEDQSCSNPSLGSRRVPIIHHPGCGVGSRLQGTLQIRI